MSRDRCLSLDRAQRIQQQQNQSVLRSGSYIPGSSHNRSPKYVASSPEVVRQNYDDNITSHTLTEYDIDSQEQFNRSCILQCDNDFEDVVARKSEEGQEEFYTVRTNQIKDLPDDFLEEFEEPSFYEISSNASFDELMCAMATPPAAERPAVEIDDVRKRIAAHIGTAASEEMADLDIDDVRKRMDAMIAASEPEPELCRDKIPPLPEDPRAIPPHPKDPKDVVAIIRRAHAIARLKAIEEAEATAKRISSVQAPKKLLIKVAPKKKQVCPPPSKNPSDYVAPEWAAAILRTRKLAGLKTRNPKLLPKPKTPQPPPPPNITLLPTPSPQLSYDNIMKRAAVLRARKEAAQAAEIAQHAPTLTPKDIDEDLEEFEVLEQLYDAAPNQFTTTVVTDTDMQDRMSALQRQLFRSPTEAEPSPGARSPPLSQSPTQAASASTSAKCAVPEYEGDLEQLQGIADWGLADLSGPHPMEILHMPKAPRDGTTFRSSTITPNARSPVRSRHGDDFLQNIEIPDFDVKEIPDFAYSAEALVDAGFDVDKNVSLGEISMPDFEEGFSIDEYGLEDVTSPELCDLSNSVSGMALEPDYPLVITEEESEEEQVAEEEFPKTQGFITSMVNAVVDSFRNIFTPTKLSKEDEKYDDSNRLDTSLPNLFETTPKPITPVPEIPEQTTPKGPIVIPPHPKDPKDVAAIVKRAQAIQKIKAKEVAEAAAAQSSTLSSKVKKGKREITASIPQSSSPSKKKALTAQKKRKDFQSAKVYPPGEYSPGYAAAVARARSLAGFKNISAALNPERAARIAAKKAAKEAELAAIEALPPVERMRAKMKKRKLGNSCHRPSIEALGTLEAIRASLPISETQTFKRKWRPTGRLRSDRRTKPEERVFTQDFGRLFTPTARTVKSKKDSRQLDVMSPLIEEPGIPEEDFMQFSPLKPHEGRMRLQYLKEQTARRAAETIRAAEEAQAIICPKTPISRRTRSPKKTVEYSPIRLRSPSSPRQEQIRRERVTTQIGENGGEETIREDVVETSTIENGEVHTSTRHVTTKTDEYGNVTCHIQEGKGMSGEEHLADVEPPDFLDTSDIPPPRNPSIPTPSEIIERIRMKVHQKLYMALPTVPESQRNQLLQSPDTIEFPEDLPDEELFDIDIPEFERTPLRESPQTRLLTPIEKDERMYAWGEQPPVASPTSRSTSLKDQIPLSPEVELFPVPKPTIPQGPIIIPPHPKDPKNYIAMVKRAQAIQRRIKEQETESADPQKTPARKIEKKGGRVLISRWIAPPSKDPKKHSRTRMVLKKRIPKAAPKRELEQELEVYDERECPAEPPPLPENYAEHVAKARLMRGLKNRTAALNPKVAAQLAAKKAAQAAYEKLPVHEKIKMRMKKVRRVPSEKRCVKASADIIGTIAAIKANMPPIEEILRPSSPYTPLTPPSQTGAKLSLRAPVRCRRSPYRFATEALQEGVENTREVWGDCQKQERLSEKIHAEKSKQPDITPLQARTPSPQRTLSPARAPKLSSDQALSREPTNFADLSNDFEDFEAMTNLSLDQLEAVQMEAKQSCPADLSLDEFEALEAQFALDEFKVLEAEAKAQAEAKFVNYETPKRKERYCGRRLFTPPPPPVKSQPLPTRSSQRLPRLSLRGWENDYNNVTLGKDDVCPGGTYEDEIQDFKIPTERIVLDTSNLMPETPTDLQERFRRLKEAHKKQRSPTRAADVYEVAAVSPIDDYSPIILMSPSGATCEATVSQITESSPSSSAREGELLIDFDKEFSQRHIRRFEDLKDMPFDELEFEDEPSFQNVSLDKSMTPPPLPSDIINRVRSKVEKKLREDAHRLPLKSPVVLEFPGELPDEELFELSAPPFVPTPQRTPPAREKSPRVSLPMAWGEVPLLTPNTSAVRASSPSRMRTPVPEIEVKVSPPTKIPSKKSPIVIPPHPKDPKDFEAIVKRAQAINKLKKQEAEAVVGTPSFEPPKKKGRVPISRWQGPPKKSNARPNKQLVMRKRGEQPAKTLDNGKEIILQHEDEDERVCPAEPPPLPENYAEHVARARLLRGLKNKTAALNPKVAARIIAKKAAEEAAAAAYAALPEHEKIKVRMERLRRKPGRHRGAKPTMEQIAYLEALKQTGAYDYKILQDPTPQRIAIPSTPRAAMCEVPLTPQRNNSQRVFAESADLAEFEALEQMESQPITCPSSRQDNTELAQRMAYLEQQLLETEEPPPMGDVSLAEYEALEAVVAPPDQCPARPVSALEISRMIAALQQQQLATPTRIDPRERYRQVLAQMQATPKSPEVTPKIHKTPNVYYSPLRLSVSPSKKETTRAEKSTTQITRSENNTIKEQVIETSEIVNGELQQVTKHVTTSTDPNGNITCQINESKRVSARDTSANLEEIENLEDIEEPSFIDTIPETPSERPRPRDIIERVGREVKMGIGKYRPEVPTGQLIDLRTPPRMLPLPKEVTEENLLDLSCPEFTITPPRTTVHSPVRTPNGRSPEYTTNISIPELFVPTPSTTPPLPPELPLRQHIPSPEGPIVIPPHPKDPTDFAAIVKRARKIEQLKAQKEDERLAAEAAKPKKNVPISRLTAPSSKKLKNLKKLAIRKRGEPIPVKTLDKAYQPKPPPLPEDYAEKIARARRLAGLKNRTAALNPKVAAKEAAKAEAARLAQEAEAARLEALNASPPPPIKDFSELLSRIASMRQKGALPKGQPSIAAAAYLNALKGAMQVRQQSVVPIESPKARYRRLKAKRAAASNPTFEVSPVRTPSLEDISYMPIRFVSPRSDDVNIDLAKVNDIEFNVADFEGLEELDKLDELREPSFMNVSELPLDEEQYMPPTPPETPTRIIRRIGQQIRKQQADVRPPTTPEALEFPEDLTEESLFELSAPSFAKSPPRHETPKLSPNISIPQYFEQTPPSTPKAVTSRSVIPRRTRSEASATEISPQLLRICPEVRPKTPEGQIVIPPHPNDPADVLAMIRRAQLIQKLRTREAAEGATKAQSKIVKKPKKGRIFRNLVLKKKAATAQSAEPPSKKCPLEPPQLPSDYLEAVAKARKLAGLKNKTALLNTKVAAKKADDSAAIQQPALPPPDFASIMERAAALRATNTSGMPQKPTARQLAAKQNLINRQQRQERKRLLRELERIRQRQIADNIPLDFGPMKTPPTARERFEVLKSRMPKETSAFVQIPYSPAKTPDSVVLPRYQPLELPKTPPYEFLENVCIPEIEDMSMPYDVLDEYEIVEEPAQRDFSADQEEFDMAEAEAAAIEHDDRIEMIQNQSLHPRQRATELDSFELAEAEAAAHEFNICERIKTLQDQLFESPRQKSVSCSTEAAAIEQKLEMAKADQDFNMAKRIKDLENRYFQSPKERPSTSKDNKITGTTRATELDSRATELDSFELAEAEAAAQEFNMCEQIKTLQNQLFKQELEMAKADQDFNMAKRIQDLENQYFQSPKERSSSPKDNKITGTARATELDSRATELDSFELAEAEAAAQEFNMCERIKTLQNQLFESPRQKLVSRSAAAAIEQELEMAKAEADSQDFDMAKRIQELENLYFQSPRERPSSPRGNKILSAVAEEEYHTADMGQYEQFLENETTVASQRQETYDEMIDDFEAMERECQ